MQYQNYEYLYEMFVVKKLAAKDIAIACGVHADTIFIWLKKLDIRRPNMREAVKCAWGVYGDINKIASSLDLTPYTVRYHLKNLNIEFAKPKRDLLGLIEAGVRLGKSFSVISVESGAALSDISRTAKKHGIKSPKAYMAEKNDVNPQAVEKYISDRSVTLQDLVSEFGRNKHAYIAALKRLGHIVRSRSEAISTIDVDRMLELHSAGKDRFEIARILGHHANSIYRKLVGFGINFRAARPAILSDKDWLSEQYVHRQRGAPYLAKKLKCPIGMVYRALRECGIQTVGTGRDKGSSHAFLNDPLALRVRYSEVSMETIARENGTAIMVVAHFLKKHGIPIRDMDQRMELMQKTTSERNGWLTYGVAKSNRTTQKLAKSSTTLRFDSDLEYRVALGYDLDPNVVSISRGLRGKCKDANSATISYAPDLLVKAVGGELKHIECKPVRKILQQRAVYRATMFKQVIAGQRMFGRDYVVSDGLMEYTADEILDSITDHDRYYADDYALMFETGVELYECLRRIGFLGFDAEGHRSHLRDFLLQPIRQLGGIINGVKVSLIARLLQHFHSDHLAKSRYKDYVSVYEAFTTRHDILKVACDKLYCSGRKRKINIFSLVSLLGKSGASLPGQFKPDIAANILAAYGNINDVVFDPCAGWGARMLGSLKCSMKYVGYDINSLSIGSNQNLAKYAKYTDCILECKDSRDQWDIDKFDILFTSPPYDDTEIYYGCPDGYRAKTSELVESCFRQSAEKLSVRGRIILNIPEWAAQNTINVAGSYGFAMDSQHKLKVSQVLMIGDKYEDVLVFKRDNC